jgi:hypothetical protein
MRQKPDRSGFSLIRQRLIPWLSVWFIVPFTLISACLKGAELKGRITGEDGEPLSYASVYVKGTTTGTTTNEKGNYSLNLKPGDYKIVYQYMGFEQQTRKVSLQADEVETLNITLTKRAYETDPVTVSGRDPAYRIIENAIDKREAYRQEVNAYECRLYTKATVSTDSVADNTFVDSADLPQGYLYLSESVSKLQYRYPDDYKEAVLSSKVSGRDEAPTLNFAFDNPVSFYKELIELGSRRPLVCPVADNALNYYDYRLINTYSDKGRRVHRIRVIPKRPNDPVFNGTIHITAESWRIHSLELSFSKANGLQTFDTFQVKQTYLPVNDSTWRLYNQNFRLKGSVVGIDLKARALAQFTEYKLDPDWANSPFDGPMVRIPDSTTDQDSAYWEEIRPFALSEEEKQDYAVKDSLQAVRSQPSYIDSVDSVRNQLSALDLLLSGYDYRRRTKNFKFEVPSIVQSFLSFNTVEGLAPRLRFSFTRLMEDGPDWQLSPFVRYGFANDQLNGGLAIEHGPWQLEGGRNVFQFQQQPPPISSSLNTSYTLFEGRNFAKFYQNAFLEASYSGDEWGNGWFPAFAVSLEERQPLTNSTSYSFSSSESFTANTPAHPHFQADGGDDLQNFSQHQALTVQAGMRYKPGLDYMMIKGEKINTGTAYPTLRVDYRKAISGIAGMDADYDYVEAGLDGNADFKLLGKLTYRASAGQFLSEERVPFVDYRHFQGQEVIYQLQQIRDFQVLDYYEASTTDRFTEAHLQHNFSGFIWNKIPFARKLQWQVSTTGNLLYQADRTYWEWGVGLTDLIGLAGSRFLGVHFFQGYRESRISGRGFRISMSSPIDL